MGSKLLSGIFIGYYQHPGGSRGGDLMVVDWEELASAVRSNEVAVRRIKAKEVFPLIQKIL